MKNETREQWLRAATKIFDKELFTPAGHKLPPMMISCGFPRGGEAIGQCWHGNASPDGETNHLFVCPTQHEPERVLDILLHELIHAALPPNTGHKGMFRKLALQFGLAGKMTATVAGPELLKRLTAMSGELGPYPHVKLLPKRNPRRPGGGGWLRLMSPQHEEYRVMISPKQLEDHGHPCDPWGNEMVEAD